MTKTFFRRTIICMIAILLSLCVKTFAQNEPKSWEVGVYAGLSLNTYTGDDIKDVDMKTGYNVGLTGRYFFLKDFFGELSLGIASKGYKQNITANSGQYWDDDGANYDSEIKKVMSTCNLDIPLHIGYCFNIGNNSNISVKAGPYFTYALSGKLKTSGYIITYPDIHSSEKETIKKEKKIGDIDGFNKFGMGISCGIGYNYKNYGITASFQRGLTKIIKDTETFEKNITFSLSYTF